MTEPHNPTGINSETSSYGFHCVIPDQDFTQAVNRVAHEVRSRLERVKSALACSTTTVTEG